MVATSVDICNRAIQKVGAASITALSDTSTQAIACNRVYETARDDELRRNNWNFAIKRARLSPQTTTITAATKADPCVLTFSGGTTPVNGDRIRITEVVGMTELNNEYYLVSGVSGSTFNLLDDDGDNLDSSAFTTYTSGGTITFVPNWGYTNRFALPSDMLRLISLDGYTGVNSNIGTFGHSESDYTIEAGYILTNDTGPIYLRYVYQVTSVPAFDITFREALSCRIAMEIAPEVLQNDSRKQGLAEEYIATMRIAKLADAIEVPGDSIPDSSWLLSRL